MHHPNERTGERSLGTLQTVLPGERQHLHRGGEMTQVTIPKKSLRRIMQVAKDNHSMNVVISVAKGVASFECGAEIVRIEGIKEAK